MQIFNSSKHPSQKVKDLKNILNAFYNSDYKPLIVDDDLNYTNLNTVLDYIAVSIVTMYENNIKLHYVEYVERYVNVIWEKKKNIDGCKKRKTPPRQIPLGHPSF